MHQGTCINCSMVSQITGHIKSYFNKTLYFLDKMLIVLLLEKMCHGLKFKKSFQFHWKNIGNVNKMFAFQELETLGQRLVHGCLHHLPIFLL